MAPLGILPQRTFGVNKKGAQRMEIAGGGESERGDRNRHVAVPAVCQFAIL